MLNLAQSKPAGSDLEHFHRMGAELNHLRINSAKAGKKTIEYVGIDGKTRREYYHSGRWNDRPSKIRNYQ